MNIWHLARAKSYKNVVLSKGCVLEAMDFSRFSSDLGSFNGFRLSPGASFTLRCANAWYPLNTLSFDVGWLAACYPGSEHSILEVTKTSTTTQEVIARSTIKAGYPPMPVFIPQSNSIHPSEEYNINVVASCSNMGSLFVGFMQNIDHSIFYQMAKGNGIEIGPGLQPRLQNSQNRSVVYLERYSSSEYLANNKGYNANEEDMKQLWAHYVVGDAHNIPHRNEGWDFIFSAHVFEHLPNPLGHLKLWHQKLSDRGKVLAIVPNIQGCFDFMFHTPSSLGEWMDQFENGALDRPRIKDYKKLECRLGRSAIDMYDDDIRPHFSFFNSENCFQLLDAACKKIGYRRFGLRAPTNNVSLEFWLEK